MERRNTHPLDVDLLSFTTGDADEDLAAQVEGHIADCLLCRVRIGRLRRADVHADHPIIGSVTVPSVSPKFLSLLAATNRPATVAAGQLWLAGDSTRTLVWIDEVNIADAYARVHAATFDIAGADDTALVHSLSDLATDVAIFNSVAGTVPLSSLETYIADVDVRDDLQRVLNAAATGNVASGVRTGARMDGAIDERREFRQLLADSLAMLDPIDEDDESWSDDGPTAVELFCGALIEDFLPLRAPMCGLEPFAASAASSVHPPSVLPVAWLHELDCHVLVAVDFWAGPSTRDDWGDVYRFVIAVGAPTLALAEPEPPHEARLYELRHLHDAYELPFASQRHPPRPLGEPLPILKALYGYFEQAALRTSPEIPVPERLDVDAFTPDFHPFTADFVASLRDQRATLGKHRALKGLTDADSSALATALGSGLAFDDLVAELDRITDR